MSMLHFKKQSSSTEKLMSKLKKVTLLWYSKLSKAYIVYNSKTNTVESSYVSWPVPSCDASKDVAHSNGQGASSSTALQFGITLKYKSSHKKDQIIANKNIPLKTRSTFRNGHLMMGLLSVIEPTSINDALKYDGWVVAILDEPNRF